MRHTTDLFVSYSQFSPEILLYVRIKVEEMIIFHKLHSCMNCYFCVLDFRTTHNRLTSVFGQMAGRVDEHNYNYRPHPKDGGRYCFQFVCQFTSRGGVPGPGPGREVPGPGPGGGSRSQIWGGTWSQVQGGYPVSVKGKIFDTRFGLIHVQTRKKIFVARPPPSKGKKF